MIREVCGVALLSRRASRHIQQHWHRTWRAGRLRQRMFGVDHSLRIKKLQGGKKNTDARRAGDEGKWILVHSLLADATSSAAPVMVGVPGAEYTGRSTASSGGLDDRDRSDELESVRPGIPGRRRGERYADGGLKERAKLAMAATSVGDGCLLVGSSVMAGDVGPVMKGARCDGDDCRRASVLGQRQRLQLTPRQVAKVEDAT